MVQDPRDAWSPAMPRYALDHSDPDLVLPLADIAQTVMETMRGGVHAASKADDFR